MHIPPRPLRSAGLALLAALGVAGCSTPSSRDNAAQAVRIVAGQTTAPAPWRRDARAEAEADARIRELLDGGLTAEESVAVCFLAHPDVQLAFEALEVSRSELVAAVTPPNPLAIVGLRQPGGNLSAFYPQRNVSFGVLQNVLGLVNLPSRRRIATTELQRARIEAADKLVGLAAEVNEAYIGYVAARRIDALRRDAAMSARALLELLRQQLGADRAAQLTLLQERTGMLQVEGNALRSALDLRTARARLAVAMGVAGRHEDWETVDALPPPPGADPEPLALELSALQNRLDLQAARQAVEARLDAAGVQARWRWFGAAEIGIFRETASGGTRFTGPSATLELPLFDQRQAQILAADAEGRAAKRRLESQMLTARGEIRTHAAELAATRALLGRFEAELLPAFRRLRDEQGETVEGRRAQLALLDAEEQHEGLLRDYWRARSALARAAGAWEAMPEWPSITQTGATAP